jgi:hypothetical protein
MAGWTDFLNSFGAGSGSTDIAGFAPALAGSLAEGASFAGPLGAALAGGSSIIQSLVGSIGRGRKEADIIVPVQNQVWEVLRVMMDDTNAAGDTMTVRQLLDEYFLTIDTYRRFDRFTRDPRFTDGRASRQARDTIRPYVDGKLDSGQFSQANPAFLTGGFLGDLERRITRRGGVAPGNVSTGGTATATNPEEYAAIAGSNNPLAPAGGGGLLAFAGVGIVLAKLLKVF